MSSTDRPERKKRDKSLSAFWRACGYLSPYRWMVVTSIICAVFVGIATAGGITTLLPIMRVLLNGDTLATWADRSIANQRLKVSFGDDQSELRLLKISSDLDDAGNVIGRSGLKPGDAISVVSQGVTASKSSDVLAVLANPAVTDVIVLDQKHLARPVQLPSVAPQFAILYNLAAHAPINPVAAIACAFGVMASIMLVGNVVRFFQEYLSDKAAILAVNDIRRRLYDHILHTPIGKFGAEGTSDVTSRLVQDSQGLQEGLKTILGQSIQEPIKIFMAFALAMYLSWQLTSFIILFGPVMFLIIKRFGKKMRRSARKAMESSSSMLGQIEASLVGIRVVKGANAERFERRRYTGIMGKLVAEQLKMSRIDAFSAPTMEMLTMILVGIVVLTATYMMTVSHTLKVEVFVLIMLALGSIGDSLRRVSKVNNVLEKSNASAARMFETMDLPAERLRKLHAASIRPRIKLPTISREVAFENITFTYPKAQSPALTNVSLRVPRGRSVAIVGRNGSGKTTLLALLPRFYDADSGRVTIDGVDVKQATLKSLRAQISIVTQESVLFPGTIATNIAYGNPLATREAIEAAAKRAFAHEFILEKPMGYDTVLDGAGGQLSGGQRQRINIARAILRQAPILILDEATSQVDAESEHLIQQAIESLMHERTTFVIAHRFSTILSADQIIVMDKGQIVGIGKHDELLKSCETYHQLYERQLPPAA
ncbi:hypothetical protein BH10PLA1_BH10PLA1_07500 [soil metagenome]